MVAIGETVGLAEWIIGDTCLVILNFTLHIFAIVYFWEYYTQDLTCTCAINDPLGQTHIHASSDYIWKLFCFARIWDMVQTDGQTTHAKIVIITGRDCESVSWIKYVISGVSRLSGFKILFCRLFCFSSFIFGILRNSIWELLLSCYSACSLKPKMF